MTVKIIKTGEELVCNDSYGARLIEQGAAIAAPGKAKSAKPADAPATKKAVKSGDA